jgi:hypothetical protein
MFTRVRRPDVTLYCALAGVLASLVAGTARADYTAPSRVDAIEQSSQNVFSGQAFVRLVGPRCAHRGDGFFILPNDSKQALHLNILLTAMSTTGVTVRMNNLPGSCVVASVSICRASGAC